MMKNKRLMEEVQSSKKYLYASVGFQWLKLLVNIYFLWQLGDLLDAGVKGKLTLSQWMGPLGLLFICVLLRMILIIFSQKMAFTAIEPIKANLRDKVFQKFFQQERRQSNALSTAETVQVASEGIEGLEVYVGRFIPQLYYSLLAPLTLFVFIGTFSLKTALLLFVCVPLIPASIMGFQRLAKRVTKKYWKTYTQLGDDFLDHVQGLTTLKIYRADEAKHQSMNQGAEAFRRATMKLLSVQLNSIVIMNFIAFGGAALSIFMATSLYLKGALSMKEAFLILMLGAEFFIPLRLLGSFFHVAMNSTTACEKLFALIDAPQNSAYGHIEANFKGKHALKISNLHFGFPDKKPLFKRFHFDMPMSGLISVVGSSGCGKSTLASLILGKEIPSLGDIELFGLPLKSYGQENLLKWVNYVGHESLLFTGTVASNLKMAAPETSDNQLWAVLEAVKLNDFVRAHGGLNYPIQTLGSNLSGGQRQRLALARALLSDAKLFIFDEATSNIDVESEHILMAQIKKLSKSHAVLLISHRLANVVDSQSIYYLSPDKEAVHGTHSSLMEQCLGYRTLYEKQEALENQKKEGKSIA